MNGFDKEFERKLFTMNYPLSIYALGQGDVSQSDVLALQKEFPHLKFSPYISSQVIIKRGRKLEGALLFGVDFTQEAQINSVVAEGLGKTIIGKYGLLAGKGIKDGFLLDKDDKLTLVFTQSEPGGFSLIPKMKRFTYEKDFSSGLIAYDKTYMYTTVESLASVLGYMTGTYDGIHVFSQNPFVDIENLKKVLPSHLNIVGWWQQNGNFFSALALEKRALFIVLMLIILVASLNIISSLLMTVMNRRQEIALLLSLGAYKEEIKKVFFCLGLIIGGGGMLCGIVLGFVGMWLLGSFDLINLPADVYGSAKLPMELSWSDFTLIVIGAAVIVAFSSYYPAKKATQVNVLETLRNE